MASKGFTGLTVLIVLAAIFLLGFAIYLQLTDRCICAHMKRRAEQDQALSELHEIRQMVETLEEKAKQKGSTGNDGDEEEAKEEIELPETARG